MFLTPILDGSRQFLDSWQVVSLFSNENYIRGMCKTEQGRDRALLTNGMNRVPHINIIYNNVNK
jgi:hypothetical protein